MSKRYSICAVEYQSDTEVVVCEVDANPEAVVEALKGKLLKVYKDGITTRRSKTGRYRTIRIVDNRAEAS